MHIIYRVTGSEHITKEYYISGNSITKIITLPDNRNPGSMIIENTGCLNSTCSSYYSHYPFKSMNELRLSGIIDKKN